jgi:hypothetical protein
MKMGNTTGALKMARNVMNGRARGVAIQAIGSPRLQSSIARFCIFIGLNTSL